MRQTPSDGVRQPYTFDGCRTAAWHFAGVLPEREPTFLQKLPCLTRHTRRHEHPQVTHGQRNVIRGPGKLRLTDPDRPIAVLLELRENLPKPERLCTGNYSQIAVGRPTSVTRPEKLVRNRPPHQRGNQPYVTRLHGGPARDRGCSE